MLSSAFDLFTIHKNFLTLPTTIQQRSEKGMASAFQISTLAGSANQFLRSKSIFLTPSLSDISSCPTFTEHEVSRTSYIDEIFLTFCRQPKTMKQASAICNSWSYLHHRFPLNYGLAVLIGRVVDDVNEIRFPTLEQKLEWIRESVVD